MPLPDAFHPSASDDFFYAYTDEDGERWRWTFEMMVEQYAARGLVDRWGGMMAFAFFDCRPGTNAKVPSYDPIFLGV